MKTYTLLSTALGLFILLSFTFQGDTKEVVKQYCHCTQMSNNSSYIDQSFLQEDCKTTLLKNILKKNLTKKLVVKELDQQCHGSMASYLLKDPNFSIEESLEMDKREKEIISNMLNTGVKAIASNEIEFFTQNVGGTYRSPEERDSLAVIQFSKGKETIAKGKLKKGGKLLKKAFKNSSHQSYIKTEIIDFLIKIKEYNTAEKLMANLSIPYDQALKLSQHYFHLGLINMKKDWSSFKTAHRYFKTAHHHMGRSTSKDLQLWSEILNAIGYTSVTSRGLSKFAQKSDAHCILVEQSFKDAFPWFVWSLKYNPNNENAQANKDSLLNIFSALQSNPPRVNMHDVPDIDTLTLVSLDSLNFEEINATDSILYDTKLLPKNHQKILQLLNEYDELVLVLDLSFSMVDPTPWSEGNSKFSIMSNLSNYLAKEYHKDHMLGVISVDNTCDPRDGIYLISGVAQKSRRELLHELQYLTPRGATPLNQRLEMTPGLFSNKNNKKSVFLLSDGLDACNEVFDLCSTASFLNDQSIDFSVFSFILQNEETVSRYEYEIYECLVQQSQGKIFHVDKEGEVKEMEIDKLKQELNLILPHLIRSDSWSSHEHLYQFSINEIFDNSINNLELKDKH